MSGGITATLVAVGVDAALAGTIATAAITGAEIGGGLGTVTGLIEGKSIGESLKGGLIGAAEGGVTAGLGTGVGPVLGGALDIGSTAGGALAGAAGGAGIAAAAGQDPLMGAASGAISGGLAGNNAPSDSGATTGAGGTPTVGQPGAPGTAPAGSSTGGFASPSSVQGLSTEGVTESLNPSSLGGDASLQASTDLGSFGDQPLSDPSSGTAVGTSNSPNNIVGGAGGGDAAPDNIGPVNSTATIGGSPSLSAPSLASDSLQSSPAPDFSTPGGMSTPADAITSSSPADASGFDTSGGSGGSVDVGGSTPIPGGSGAAVPSISTPLAGGSVSLKDLGSNLGNVSGAVSTAAPSTPGLLTNLGNGNFSAAADNVGSFLSNPSNIPLELGAGYVGLESMMGPPPLPSSAKPLLENGAVTAPLIATEQSQLAEANSGTLTPGQQAGVDKYINDSKNQLFQQLASQGVQNPMQDSRYQSGMDQITQQASIMTQQYIQASFQNAFTAAGQAAGDLSAAATLQNNSDSAFTSSMSTAVGALGSLNALSSMKKAA